MRCTMYDWIRQSDQHLSYAASNWPTAAEIAVRSTDRNDYMRRARSLNIYARQVLKRERDDWFSKYGFAWRKLGCPREPSVHQRSFMMTAPVIGATSVFDPDYGEEWDDNGWDDDASGTSSGDLPPMYEDLPNEPTLPTGYHKCYNPQVQGMPVTVDVPANQPGWRVDHYVGKDDQLYYYYHAENGDFFWACPKIGSSYSAKKEEVKQIQVALRSRGYNPGPIDGIFGPKTCSAAYAFSYNHKGYADPTLDEDLFEALDLGGRGYGARYARSCDAWFTGELGGEPIPEEDVVVTTPVITAPGAPEPATPVIAPKKPKKAGFGLVVGIIVGGTLLGGIIVDQIKKRKKKKR